MLVPGLIKLGNSSGAPCVDMCGHYEETDSCCWAINFHTTKPLTEYQTINFWIKPASAKPLLFNTVMCYDQLNFYNIHLIKEQNDVTVFVNGENVGRYTKPLPNDIGTLIKNICSEYTGTIHCYMTNIRIIDNDVIDVTSFIGYKFNSVMNKKYTGSTLLTYHFKFDDETNLGKNSVGDDWNIAGAHYYDIPWDNCYTLNPYSEVRLSENRLSRGNLYSYCGYTDNENYHWFGLPKKGKYLIEFYDIQSGESNHRTFACHVNGVGKASSNYGTIGLTVDHKNRIACGYRQGNLQHGHTFKFTEDTVTRFLQISNGNKYSTTANFGQKRFRYPVEGFSRLSAKNLSCDDIETEGEFVGWVGHHSPGRVVHTNCNFETLTIDGTEFYNDGTRNPHVRFFSWGFKMVPNSPFNSSANHTWSGIVKNNWNCNNGEYATS